LCEHANGFTAGTPSEIQHRFFRQLVIATINAALNSVRPCPRSMTIASRTTLGLCVHRVAFTMRGSTFNNAVAVII
jgi:hypothetical protein